MKRKWLISSKIVIHSSPLDYSTIRFLNLHWHWLLTMYRPHYQTWFNHFKLKASCSLWPFLLQTSVISAKCAILSYLHKRRKSFLQDLSRRLRRPSSFRIPCNWSNLSASINVEKAWSDRIILQITVVSLSAIHS